MRKHRKTQKAVRFLNPLNPPYQGDFKRECVSPIEFTFRVNRLQGQISMPIKKILITGASGYLAQFIIDRLREAYQLTLTDIVEPETSISRHDFYQGRCNVSI